MGNWRFQPGRAIFAEVKLRVLRPWVLALVVVQLLLNVPVASAWSTEAQVETPTAMPCDDAGSDEHHSKHCPCCPDGVTSTLDCQTSCTSGLAMLPVAQRFLSIAGVVPVDEPKTLSFHPPADPPLNPPPIC